MCTINIELDHTGDGSICERVCNAYAARRGWRSVEEDGSKEDFVSLLLQEEIIRFTKTYEREKAEEDARKAAQQAVDIDLPVVAACQIARSGVTELLQAASHAILDPNPPEMSRNNEYYRQG